MYKNYFFLNRLIIELNPLLNGKKIIDIFTQDKARLVLEAGNSESSIFLEMCVEPGNTYLTLKEKFSKSKKNTYNLFNAAIYAIIKGIYIAEDDRIISIITSSGNLFFTIRGKFSNIHFIDVNEKIESFLKPKDDNISELINELTSKTYISSPNNPDLLSDEDNDYYDIMRKKYPIIGKEIIQECRSRSGKPQLILNKVIEEIFSSQTAVFVNKKAGEVNIGFENFHIFPNAESQKFNNLISAQDYFINTKYYLDDWNNKQNRISKHISRELNKISSKINNLKSVIDKGSKEEEYHKIGNLILINLNNISQGKQEIELKDIYDPDRKRIRIKIDTKLSLKQNADKYFEKARNQKISVENSKRLLKSAQQDFKKYKDLEEKITSIDSIKELNNIMKNLKIKFEETLKRENDIRTKFKHYVINEKYHVFVGKDSKNNDLLTTKFAKQNDYWFHARSVSGSHVVLRIENTKESVPKEILRKAASLAAYHSKAKTAGLVPVSYCLKKYVVKKKGSPAGQVFLLKEASIIVRPEIPKKCEYIENE